MSAGPPLAGVTVLDLSRILAGPWCTQLLGDLGADVIKIERPGVGDDTRQWGPPFLANPDHSPGDAGYFLAANRNKRSVAIDLAQPDGADLVRRLVARADLVVENFKRGDLARYGLEPAALRIAHPALVTVSITGYGESGPWADRPGYDAVIQAVSGLQSITGPMGGDGMKVGVAVTDIVTGLTAASAALAALLQARATGQGRHIDMSLFDCAATLLANQAVNALLTGSDPVPRGNAHPNIVPYQTFPTADAPLAVAVGNDRQFGAFAAALGDAEWARDARFATNAARVTHRDTLIPLIEKRLASDDAAAWEARLTQAGVPCGRVNTVSEAFALTQARSRGLPLTLTRPDGVTTPTPGAPVGEGPPGGHIAPPTLGADTAAVLRERLGLRDADIGALADRGVGGLAQPLSHFSESDGGETTTHASP